MDAGCLRLRDFVVKIITIIKFAVGDIGGYGTECCGIEVRADTAGSGV